MSVPVSSPLRRYRRRILGLGVLRRGGAVWSRGAAVPRQRRARSRGSRALRTGGTWLRGRVGDVLGAGRRAAVCRTVGRAGGRDRRRHRRLGCPGDRARPLVPRRRLTGGDRRRGHAIRRRRPALRPVLSTTRRPIRRRRLRPRRRTERPTSIRSSRSSTSGPQFSILASLIDESDVAELLTEEGPFTLFAPSDDAFDAMPPDTLAELRRDPDSLDALLRHHIAAGAHPSERARARCAGDARRDHAAGHGRRRRDHDRRRRDHDAGPRRRQRRGPRHRRGAAARTSRAGRPRPDGVGDVGRRAGRAGRDRRRREPARHARRRRVPVPGPGQRRRPTHRLGRRGASTTRRSMPWPSWWRRCRRTS